MDNPDAPNVQEIKHKAAKGIGWNYISFGLGKLFSFITVSILAHMLTPKAFGLVSLATVAINYYASVNELGLNAALIHVRKRFNDASNSVFTINVIFGTFLTLITFLTAPLVANFFEEPAVTPVLQALGFSFIIRSFGSVHRVILERDLDFQKKIIPQTSNALIKGAESITLALLNYGVWALVIGQLLGALTEVITLWLVVPWRPKVEIKWVVVKDLFQFGISVLVVNVVSIIEDNFDYLIIGKMLGTERLGIYTIAYRLPELLVINTLWIMASVFFPMFAAIQENTKALKENFLNTIRYVQIIIVPISIGLFVAADPIVRVFFGNQWLDAIPIMRLLSVYALIVSIGYHAGDYYKAIGKPDILAKIEIPIFFVRITALWLGAQYGMYGVAIAHISVASLEAIVRLIVASNVIKINIGEILNQLKPIFAGIVLALFTIPAILLTSSSSSLLQLLSIVLSGIAGYAISIWLIERESLREIVQIVKN
jgi:PST family polysaccharide transporter